MFICIDVDDMPFTILLHIQSDSVLINLQFHEVYFGVFLNENHDNNNSKQ